MVSASFTGPVRIALRCAALAMLAVAAVFAQAHGFSPFPPGTGTESDPLEISTAAQMAEIAELVNAGELESFVAGNPGAIIHIKMVKDIGLAAAYGENTPFNDGKGWIPAGTAAAPFKGVFDGNGFMVYGLFINNGAINNTGLFGYVTGVVRNVGLAGASVSGRGNAGGIVGGVGGGGVVENCFVTGIVKGESNVGGVAGSVAVGGAVRNCFALNYRVASTFESDVNVGRVAGSSVGTLINNYAWDGTEVRYGYLGLAEKIITNSAHSQIDGGNRTAEEIKTAARWTSPNYWSIAPPAFAWDFTGVWAWDNSGVIMPANRQSAGYPWPAYLSGGGITPPAQITVAAITVTAPVEGATPGTAATAGGAAGFTVGPVTWSPADSPFKGGVQYTASVTLTASANHAFSPTELAATINGNPAGVAYRGGGSSVTLSYTFGSAGGQTSAGIRFLSPTSNKDLGASGPDFMDTDVEGLTYTAKIGVVDKFGHAYGASLPVDLVVWADGAMTAGAVRTSAVTGLAEFSVVLAGCAGGNVMFIASAEIGGAAVADTAYLVVGAQSPRPGLGQTAGEAAAVPAAGPPAVRLRAGPNPAGKFAGAVNFYHTGANAPFAGRLSIYNNTGSIVNETVITGAPGGGHAGSWDLRDMRGLPVPGGTYLAKGVVEFPDGRREKISLLLIIR